MIYVIDSADHDRLSIAGEELAGMLREEELQDAHLLVFANKQDQEGAVGPGEVTSRLGLHLLKERSWRIEGCSAVNGQGLSEGLDWLVNIIKEGRS